MKKKPILYIKTEDCSGCSACMAICSTNAIKFEYNLEGFLYPNIDYTKCIGCLKCEDVCAFKKDMIKPIQENSQTHIYAAKILNHEILINSSSGGMFTLLSDIFLENDDMVVACNYSYENNAVSFSFINGKKERDKARGSKYIQAEVDETFKDIIKWLKKFPNNKMLVVGTGCQIAGLDLLLKDKNLRNRVILVDLICHGVPSSKLWKDYINKIEEENKGNIDYITFKNKRNGWENPSIFAKIKEKEVSIKPYADWFYMGWTLRESCYKCPYTRLDRHSDITIGDFWGIQNVIPNIYDKLGVSLVITHSEEGEKIFDKIKNKIIFYESNRVDCLQPRLVSPQIRPSNRDLFWLDMNSKGIDYCIKKYFEHHEITIKEKIKRLIKRLIK